MLLLKAQFDKNNITLDMLFSGSDLVVDISLYKDDNIVWNYLLPYQDFLNKPIKQDDQGTWENNLLNYLISRDAFLGYILYISEQDLLISTSNNNITIPYSNVSATIKRMIKDGDVCYLDVWYTKTTRTFIHTRRKNQEEVVERSTQVGVCVLGKHNYVYNADDIADKLAGDTLDCVVKDTLWLRYSQVGDVLYGLINTNNLCVVCNGEKVDTKYFMSLYNDSVCNDVDVVSTNIDKAVDVANNIKDGGKTALSDFKLYNKIESEPPSLKKNKKNISISDCSGRYSKNNYTVFDDSNYIYTDKYPWLIDKRFTKN